MDFLPLHTFRRCVARYPSNYPTKTFRSRSVFEHGVCAIDVSRSLRDIEVCLRAHETKLYHLAGIRGPRRAQQSRRRERETRLALSRSCHERADYRGTEALCRPMPSPLIWTTTVYALDTTTIDLSLKVFRGRFSQDLQSRRQRIEHTCRLPSLARRNSAQHPMLSHSLPRTTKNLPHEWKAERKSLL